MRLASYVAMPLKAGRLTGSIALSGVETMPILHGGARKQTANAKKLKRVSFAQPQYRSKVRVESGHIALTHVGKRHT